MRVDTGLASGLFISPYYDPMVAKIISWGETREDARLRLKKALLDTTLFGLKTNKEFLLNILDIEQFKLGKNTTSFLNLHEKEILGHFKKDTFTKDSIACCIEYELRRDSFINWHEVSFELQNWSNSKTLPYYIHYKRNEKDQYFSVLPFPFEKGVYEVSEIDESLENKGEGKRRKIKVKVFEKMIQNFELKWIIKHILFLIFIRRQKRITIFF